MKRINYSYLLYAQRASEGTLSRWSRLHLQSSASTNPHWARVMGYGSFSLWVIRKEGLCPSSGGIRLMTVRTTARHVVQNCSIFSMKYILY
jgi:hypothetical protein